MHFIWISADRSVIAIFLLLSWLASFKIPKLYLSFHEKDLYEKLRKSIYLLHSIVLLSAIMVATNIILHWSYYQTYHAAMITVHFSCVILPMFMLWFVSRPRLFLLTKRTTAQTFRALDTARRRHASHPDLVAPFQISALGATIVIICSMFPISAFTWGDSFLAMTVFVLFSMIIWAIQHRNNEQATAATMCVHQQPEEQLRHRY
ncbi:hypothetical protein ACFSTH_18340 [Paenibacillus yanchengensis]|uniref:Uncharacterized protein n=1 Tax=Paenibacillus yanchengensis TaxID=2035833 RepID=A0ABW4YPA4_9BACL